MESIASFVSRAFTLKLNALEFAQHISHTESHIDYCSMHQFSIGDIVCLRCFSVESDVFTGCYIFRYVIAITNRCALLSDDTVYRLWLSPFKPKSI